MRLALSNLAWSVEMEAKVLPYFRGWGVEGVEVAPTRIAPWKELTPRRLRRWLGALAAHGLEVSSLQAIYFGRPAGELLGSQASFDALCEHTKTLAEIAGVLGAAVAVFGAPRTRARGGLPEDRAFDLCAERLPRLGAIAFPAGLVLGIEPVPTFYGGDFLRTADEVLRMVRTVNHPGIRLHLDTSCVILGGGDISIALSEGKRELVHMHASQPKLASFEEPLSDHEAAGAALRAIGYTGWVAIEMLEKKDQVLERLRIASAFVRRTYLGICDASKD